MKRIPASVDRAESKGKTVLKEMDRPKEWAEISRPKQGGRSRQK